ncbi:MAG: hypothetical protein IJT94_12820 [Oscillibacter sp.]|nr:hypothetical protein [Oscillibacter sp.]
MDGQTALIKELRDNPALVRQLMGSRDAQALLRAVQGGGFREAVRSAAEGDSGELSRRLRAVASTPDGAALLGRLEQSLNRQLGHGGV